MPRDRITTEEKASIEYMLEDGLDDAEILEVCPKYKAEVHRARFAFNTVTEPPEDLIRKPSLEAGLLPKPQKVLSEEQKAKMQAGRRKKTEQKESEQPLAVLKQETLTSEEAAAKVEGRRIKIAYNFHGVACEETHLVTTFRGVTGDASERTIHFYAENGGQRAVLVSEIVKVW